MAHTDEQPIAGVTSGLIGLDETVTWKAKHLMKTRILKSRISAMNRPFSFTDEMVSGDFRSLRHEHHFKPTGNGTLMIDLMHFESPYGSLGRLINNIFLTRYLRGLLEMRNHQLKEYAESEKWKFILEK